MKTKENEKQKFADRLNHALDLYGIPPKGKGRQVLLAKLFNVNQKAACKWLEAINYPEVDRIRIIADGLGVSFAWLISGKGDPKDKESTSQNWSKTPLLTWTEATQWKNFKPNKNTKWISTFVDISSKAYALSVPEEDDSMEPQIQPLSILIVDPNLPLKNKSIVIVRSSQIKKAFCRQLLIESSCMFLKAHKKYTPIINLSNNPDKFMLCGGVKQIYLPV